MDIQIILREAYEIAYGIYDHVHGPIDRTMSLVALHPKENYNEGSRLYQTIRRYRIYEVNKHFGLNLTEFLELPREFTELIFSILSEEAQKEAPRIQKELERLERSGGLGGGDSVRGRR